MNRFWEVFSASENRIIKYLWFISFFIEVRTITTYLWSQKTDSWTCEANGIEYTSNIFGPGSWRDIWQMKVYSQRRGGTPPESSKLFALCFVPIWGCSLSGWNINDAYAVLRLFAQLRPTLCPQLQATRLLCPWGFSRQEYWSGLPCPLPRDLPNPGIEPGLPDCRRTLYLLSHWGSPVMHMEPCKSKFSVFVFCFLFCFFFFFGYSWEALKSL